MEIQLIGKGTAIFFWLNSQEFSHFSVNPTIEIYLEGFKTVAGGLGEANTTGHSSFLDHVDRDL